MTLGIDIDDTLTNTKEKQKMLMCVIPTREYYRLKEGISKIDSEAFFLITDSYEVKGGA